MRRVLMFFAAGLVLMGAWVMPASADSINPVSVSGTLAVGGSVTITKSVTVSAGAPTAAQGDVFFLCDTTGSMGGTIGSVRTNASAILAGLAGYGNVSTGAGSYRDFPMSGWGSSGDYAYRLDAAINGAASTQAGINSWTAGGGADWYESELYGLQQATTQTATGWRAGSEKFIIWFGDAPGHEPSNTAGYPGPSTATTLAALQAAGVTVFAFDVGGGMNGEGQVTTITGGTGGARYTSLGTSVVDTIIAAIGEGFSTYSLVGIEVPALAGLDIDVVPVSFSGSYDRSIERTFMFEVTFTGVAPGTYDFSIFGTVDGGRIAEEIDSITVVGTAVPEPAALLLLGLGLAGLAGTRRFTK